MERLSAVIDDNSITYRGETREVSGLAEAFPGVWAFQFYSDGGVAERRSDGGHEAASRDAYDALVLAWQTNEPPAPPEPTLSEAKVAKLAELRVATDAAVAAVRGQYPETERETWDQQAKEAEAYLADTSQDPAAVAPLLLAIAQARDWSVADLAQRVLDKQAVFKALAGQAVGHRQLLEDQVEAATSVAEVQAIQW